jgi:hypothetical protein
LVLFGLVGLFFPNPKKAPISKHFAPKRFYLGFGPAGVHSRDGVTLALLDGPYWGIRRIVHMSGLEVIKKIFSRPLNLKERPLADVSNISHQLYWPCFA